MADTYHKMIHDASARGLLPWKPQPGTTMVILLDDDGLIVTCPVSRELIDTDPELVSGEVVPRMLDKRRALR